MGLATNLRQQRKKAGLTQIDLAEKLGVSIATLRRWESGETAPTGTRMVEIANLLKISPDELIKDDGNPASGRASFLYPAHEASNGIGTRVELPPTEKGYELFNKLIENLIERKKQLKQSAEEELPF